MSIAQLTPDRRRELTVQLDSARHAVGDARRAGDPAAEATAHARLHTAQTALGQHHATWWELAA